MSGIRGQSKYTFKVCENIAEKCRTKADFKRTCAAAYAKSRKMGWLAMFTWFENGKKHPKRLTYEVCELAARQCDSLKQFYKEYYSEWAASKRQGWLGSFNWLRRAYHAEWDHESCRSEALKYKTKKEFREGSAGAYSVARDNGWLDEEFTWLKDQTINLEYGRIYSVYRYEFELEGKKYEYVGLTMRPRERDRRHREEESAVHSFADAHGVPFPEMIIIEKNLTQEEARNKEDWYRRIFESAGYELLNRGPTGGKVGSVGGMHRKWTKKACLAEARKYRTKNDFRIANGGAYLACARHGWMKECFWFVNGRCGARKNTKEYCEKCARKFTTLVEFCREYPFAYQVAKKNGWLVGYSWLLRKGELPIEIQIKVVEHYRDGLSIKGIANKLDIKVGAARKVIIATIPREYRGRRASIIDTKKVLSDLQLPWNGSKRELALSHGFPSTDSLSAFLKRHGVEMQCRKCRLTRTDCLDAAKKCKTRSEFQKSYPGAYGRSLSEGWMNDYHWFVNGRIKWTLKACQQESKKYRTKSEFKRRCSTAYRVCCQKGWLQQMGPFENGKKIRIYKWEVASCTEEAKKYTKISDFAHKALGAYKYAKRHDLLKSFIWFRKYAQK